MGTSILKTTWLYSDCQWTDPDWIDGGWIMNVTQAHGQIVSLSLLT